jgi:GNAT superfamily N-acetyltransferase
MKDKYAPLTLRKACFDDLEDIVALLFEDELGQKRESLSLPLAPSYAEAFSKICEDPNSELIVAEFDSKLIGVLQITYLYHLTFQGSRVAHIEGVRIHKEHQKKGFGKKMFQWVIERAKAKGCNRVQLMTDKSRTEAHKFYKQIGFSSTHEGMKLFI